MMKTDILCTKIQTFLFFVTKNLNTEISFCFISYMVLLARFYNVLFMLCCFLSFVLMTIIFHVFFWLLGIIAIFIHVFFFFFFFFNFLSSRNCCWMNLHGRNDRIGFAKYSSQFSVSFVFFDIRDFHWMMFSKAFFSLFQAFFMSEFDFFLSKSWGKSKILIKRNVLRWF